CGRWDVFVGVAAVSDFAPEQPAEGKIPTERGELDVRLVPTPKILDGVRDLQPDCLVVGFKAEAVDSDDALISAGLKRMERARADRMIANRASAFESDHNEVFLLGSGAPLRVAGPKAALAAKMWDWIESAWDSSGS
ncbi:MAG: phosphopantothenoylcysteine decarboxylase, partial [Candidatus Eremiobacterota bacterium]